MSKTGTSERNTVPVQDVPPEIAREWLTSGEAVLIDVREPFEHAAERVAGSVHQTLSSLDPAELHDRHGGQRLIFACRTGRRSEEAACAYYGVSGEALHLAGGLERWKSEGFDVERSERAPRLDVMRQVQMIAGSLVLLGVLLGVFVSEGFLAISGIVAAGLMFAGATGWCGMAILLGKMPWNRLRDGSSSVSCRSVAG